MKNCVIVAIVAAVVALILGVITLLYGNSIIISARGWNGGAQTLLLLSIACGMLKPGEKK